MSDSKTYFCSFCAKSKHEVGKLIAGPGPNFFICDECATLCMEIVTGESSTKPLSGEAEYASWVLDAPRPANPTEALAGALAEAMADQFAALAARLADIDAKIRELDERPRFCDIRPGRRSIP